MEDKDLYQNEESEKKSSWLSVLYGVIGFVLAVVTVFVINL